MERSIHSRLGTQRIKLNGISPESPSQTHLAVPGKDMSSANNGLWKVSRSGQSLVTQSAILRLFEIQSCRQPIGRASTLEDPEHSGQHHRAKNTPDLLMDHHDSRQQFFISPIKEQITLINGTKEAGTPIPHVIARLCFHSQETACLRMSLAASQLWPMEPCTPASGNECVNV